MKWISLTFLRVIAKTARKESKVFWNFADVRKKDRVQRKNCCFGSGRSWCYISRDAFICYGLMTRLHFTLAQSECYCRQYTEVKTAPDLDLVKIQQYVEGAGAAFPRKEIEETLHYNRDYLNRIFRQYTRFTLGTTAARYAWRRQRTGCCIPAIPSNGLQSK